MDIFKNKLFIIILIPVIIIIAGLSYMLITGAGIKGRISPDIQKKMQPITINYWRVWDGPEDFTEIIARYKQLHPNIDIKYKKLLFEEFEDELIEALATDRGPDIFSIHNTWVRGYQSRGLLEPAPEKITMVFPSVEGNIKKEVTFEKITKTAITPAKVKELYVDVIYDDVVIKVNDEKTKISKEKLFGLPLAIDTMALFYNKDLFNNAGIANPPEYWNRDFQQGVKKLTKQNNKGEIIQSGVALGGSDNINRATDILAVLMMQNGTEMMRGTEVTFHTRPEGFIDKNYNPGLDALRFYTDFANPAKEVYSWNSTLDNSLDMFIDNKLAMMFGYTYMIEDIKARAPKLNFSITKLPQIENSMQNINYANYWVEVVSKKSKFPEEAWDFIHFINRSDQITKYLNSAKKPTALRAVINNQLEDEEIGVFAQQVLTSKSWYRGDDAEAAETIIKDMINKVNKSEEEIGDIIGATARKVQQTIKIY